MLTHTVLLTLLLYKVSTTWGVNIIFISLTHSPSHTIWDKTLAFALQRNHNITFVTHERLTPTQNVTTIIFEDVNEKLREEFPIEHPYDYTAKEKCDNLFHTMHTQSLLDSKTKGLQTLIDHIKSGKRYDLVVWDSTSGYFLLYYLIEKFNPPVIATASYGMSPSLSRYFGQDYNSAYIPLWSTGFTDQMSFFERAYNLALTYYTVYRKEQFKYYEMELARKVFGLNATNYEVLEKRITLLLMNNDPVMDYPFPIPPTIIPVAGLHIKRPGKIPQDLKDILDRSNDGVVLFSLGTNIRFKNLDPKLRNVFIKGLSRLKQTVLWKCEEEIEDLPKNIIVRKWIPQNEVLGHPNVKLFISHCGNLGTQEAMYHGVPVIGLPFFLDQFVVLKKLVRRKLGKELSYKDLTEDSIYETVTEVLNDPTYRENMKKVSDRYRDQPQEALERAVFWVEYVIRHNGADHLHIGAKNLSFVQLYFLDLWTLIVVALFSVCFVFVKGYRAVFVDRGEKLKKS